MWVIGRDFKVWVDLFKFYLECFLEGLYCEIEMFGKSFNFLLFGLGCWVCMGIMLGIFLVEVSVVVFFYFFDWILLVEGIDMIEG